MKKRELKLEPQKLVTYHIGLMKFYDEKDRSRYVLVKKFETGYLIVNRS